MIAYICGCLTPIILYLIVLIRKRKEKKDDLDLVEMYKQENFNLEKKIKSKEKELLKSRKRMLDIDKKLKDIDNAKTISDSDVAKSFDR